MAAETSSSNEVKQRASSWTFLTNHGHVFFLLARDPDLRLREIADAVGVTERAAFAIVHDLEAGGYLTRQRVGRRNTYEVNKDQPLRHPLEAGTLVGDIVDALQRGEAARPAAD